MKKVNFYINALGGGGAEKVLVDIISNLDDSKYKIVLYTLFDGGVYRDKIRKNVKIVPMITVQNKIIRHLLAYLILFVLPPHLVYRLFVRDEADIEIAFLEGFPTKLVAASNQKSKKYAWVHIDLVAYDHNQKVYGSYEKAKRCYEGFERIFCVSNDVKERFIEKFAMDNKVSTQYNVLDDQQIKIRAKETIDLGEHSGMRLVTVGRLTDQKGYDRLISVCNDLKKEGYAFQLNIVGSGPDEEKLQTMVRKYELEKDVRFWGFQDNPYKFIAACDLFVCSSRAEGFSTVATEATILGIPIITTECAGMRDLLGESEYGLIVENSEQGLKNGLRRILDDKELYMSYTEKAKVRGTYFCKKKRVEELEEILDE